MKRFAMGYEYFARIIMMILIVHIAVIVHTLLGLVVCGFFPSLAASNTTYRTWLLEVEDRSWTVKHTWTVFHRAWKQELDRPTPSAGRSSPSGRCSSGNTGSP